MIVAWGREFSMEVNWLPGPCSFRNQKRVITASSDQVKFFRINLKLIHLHF